MIGTPLSPPMPRYARFAGCRRLPLTPAAIIATPLRRFWLRHCRHARCCQRHDAARFRRHAADYAS